MARVKCGAQSRSQSRLYQSKPPPEAEAAALIAAVQPSTTNKVGRLQAAVTPAGSPARAAARVRSPQRCTAAAGGTKQNKAEAGDVDEQVMMI